MAFDSGAYQCSAFVVISQYYLLVVFKNKYEIMSSTVFIGHEPAAVS